MQFGDCLDKVIGVLAPAAVAAVAVAEKGFELLELAEPASGIVVGGVALAMHLAKQNRNECAAALKRVRKQLETELQRDYEARGFGTAFLDDAFAEIDFVLPQARPSNDELVRQWRLDPQKVADGMVGKLAAASRMIRQDERVRAIAATMIGRAVEAIKDDPDLHAKLQPAIAREILADLPEMKALLHRLVEDSSEQKAEIRGLRQQVATLTAMWEASMTPAQKKRVEAAGISGELGRAIARNAGLTAPDKEAAGLMTGEAVEIALDLTERDSQSDQSRAVRSAIEDITVLVRAGRLDQAGDRADQALAEADQRRLSDADRLALLRRVMDIDMLRFDYDGAVARLDAIVAIEMPNASPEERFAELLDRQRGWLTRDIVGTVLSGKAYIALSLALAISRRAGTPFEVMQSAVAAIKSAQAIGSRLRNSWATASVVRAVVRDARIAAMTELVSAFGAKMPWGANKALADAVAGYGTRTKISPFGGARVEPDRFEQWELDCTGFPLASEDIWSRLPPGLLAVLRLAVLDAFDKGMDRSLLPEAFEDFVMTDPDAGAILSRAYVGASAAERQLAQPLSGFFAAFAAHHQAGARASAAADHLLEPAAAVAAQDSSRTAAETFEVIGLRYRERFWTGGDSAEIERAAASLSAAAERFVALRDQRAVDRLTALQREISLLLDQINRPGAGSISW